MEDARIMNSVEGLCEEMETVRGFCYLGDRVNGGGGWEAAVTLYMNFPSRNARE